MTHERAEGAEAHTGDVEVSALADGDDIRVHGMSMEHLMAYPRDGDHNTVTRIQTDAEREADNPVLTEREADIVRLIAKGRSNEEVARTVFLSINTVKSHIRTAYRKMGVETRSQAVLWAVQHGIVDSQQVRTE